VEEGGGGRQVQRPSKLVTQKLRLDRERARCGDQIASEPK
jgi:hypothetical protein